MKKIVSSGLLVFLVLAAAALLSGGSQADAHLPTSPWTGQWTCAWQDTDGHVLGHKEMHAIMHMTIDEDGHIVTEIWALQQFDEYLVEGVEVGESDIVEEDFPMIEAKAYKDFPGPNGNSIEMEALMRCLGSLYDESTKTFTRAYCHSWMGPKDAGGVGPHATESAECVRTLKPGPHKKKHR